MNEITVSNPKELMHEYKIRSYNELFQNMMLLCRCEINQIDSQYIRAQDYEFMNQYYIFTRQKLRLEPSELPNDYRLISAFLIGVCFRKIVEIEPTFASLVTEFLDLLEQRMHGNQRLNVRRCARLLKQIKLYYFDSNIQMNQTPNSNNISKHLEGLRVLFSNFQISKDYNNNDL
jgi:hypothetical protein